MAEIKRRNKSPETNEENGGGNPPRRQTRVSLAQDVSSRYRKVMPKSESTFAGRKSADGQAPPERRSRKFGGGESGSSSRPRYENRGESSSSSRPRYENRGESGSSSRPRYENRGESGSSSRPRNESSRWSSASRPASAGSRRPGSNRGAPPRRPGGPPPRRNNVPRNDNRLELRAIVDRELPEATKQVKEVQALILSTANDLLSLVETLEQRHADCAQRLASLASGDQVDSAESTRLLNELNERFNEALKIITGLYEKMSFQDLSGQRLLKVETFLGALAAVLNPLANPVGRYKQGDRYSPAGRPDSRTGPQKYSDNQRPQTWNNRPRYSESDGAARRSEKSSLKGPQAEGEGKNQSEIDRLLSGL